MCENAKREEWRERFRAVAKAQSRYLWILLVVGIFYLALDRTVSEHTESSRQTLPLIGIDVDSKTVWASGSFVLGLIALAALGTFPAVTHASSKLNLDGDGCDFERLDIEPTAIDFIVYTKPGTSKWARLGLATYPSYITFWVGVSAWLWIRLAGSRPLSALQYVFLFSGGAATVLCLPRLGALWTSKLRSMIKGK